MTVDPRNGGKLVCGIVSIELAGKNENIAKLRVAADYAGRDTKDPDNRTGYFDVVAYEDDKNPNMEFVFKQIREKKMKKGSQVIIDYKLDNPRWAADDGTGRQKVELIANALTYVGSSNKRSDSDGEEGEEIVSTDDTAVATTTSSASGGVPQKF